MLATFFQFVSFTQASLAQVLVSLSGQAGPYVLCLDRTNWKLGKTDINFLVLALVSKKIRLLILWKISVDHSGNSDWKDRKELLDQWLGVFGVEKIKILLFRISSG